MLTPADEWFLMRKPPLSMSAFHHNISANNRALQQCSSPGRSCWQYCLTPHLEFRLPLQTDTTLGQLAPVIGSAVYPE